MSKPRRFRPNGWDALEERVVLSSIGLRSPIDRAAIRAEWAQAAADRAANRPPLQAARRQGPIATPPAFRGSQQFPNPRAVVHQTPAVVIDQQYAAFSADIAAAVAVYQENLELGAVQSQPVTLTLFSPYNPGDTTLDVGSLTFPPPTEEAPLILSAILPDGTANPFQATGGGGGILTGVTFLGEEGTDVPLPAGTSLETRIPFDQAVVNDVANQYTNYVSQRTLTLSRDLVSYFNRLPIRLPRLPGPYFTPRPETAIQFYLSNQIAGQGPQLLLQQLLALPLPSSTGSAVDLYVQSASSIIEGSRQQVNEGVRLLFSGRSVLGVGQLTPAIPGQP
jgi:hypothetical protein